MKKFYSIFFMLAMSFTAITYAVPYLPGAENETSSASLVESEQISERNNAPMATYNFSWDNCVWDRGILYVGNNSYGLQKVNYIEEFSFTNSQSNNIQLDLIYSQYDVFLDYGRVTTIAPSTYTVSTSYTSTAWNNNRAICAIGNRAEAYGYSSAIGQYAYYNYFTSSITGNEYDNVGYVSSSLNGYYLKSGTFTIEGGRHGYPYIYSTNTKNSNTGSHTINIGDSRALTTSYTSCRVATDEENGKAVLQAYDGTNTLTLVFNIASVDANIGIPAKQYTVGTDVWGGCTDDDGYTRWMFKSGKITISKSSNKLSMSTSSLKGTSSGSDFDMNLTISSKTPDMTFTAVNLSEGKISGYDDTNYSPFLVSSSQGNDIINIYMPFTQASNFTSSQKFAAFFGPDQNGNYASSSYITKNGTKYVMSQGVAVIDYDKTYQVAELTSAYLNSGTFYYIHTITSQVNNSSAWNKFYFSGERNAAFSATFSAATPADHDAEKAYFSVNNGSQSMYLTFYTDDTKDGVVPSGTYDVRANKKDNTVYVGTYSSGLRDSRGQQSSYWWLLRFGTVEVFNLNETYYITQGTTLLSARDNNITFTIGTAPKDVTLTTPAANGTAKIQFTATNWNNKVIDYASGTAHKFFQDQTIALTATPASGYRVRYWTLGGTKINGSEYQNTYNYTVGSDATQTIAAVFEQYYTATITEPTNGTITVTYTNDLGSQTLTSGSDSIAAGTSLTISAEEIGGYELDELTVNTVAFTSGETHTLNANATIAATFKQAITNYNLGEWNANDGTIKTAGTEAGSYAADTELTAPELNTRAGYTFNKWRDVTNGVDFNGYMPANDVTYTAQWTRKTYTLSATTNPAGLGTVTISPTAPYHYLDEVTLTAPEVTGYTFSGWGGTNSSMMSGDVFTFSADAANNTAYAVTANYTPIHHTVTVESNNNDYGTVSQASVTNVPYGTVITTGTGENANKVTINGTTVTATPAASDAQYSYAFSGWTNGAATVTGNTTVTANFTRSVNKYAVNFATPANGSIAVTAGGTPISSGTQVGYNTTLTITATANTGYALSAWTGDISSESTSNTTVTYTVTGPTTLGATFTLIARPVVTLYDIEAEPTDNLGHTGIAELKAAWGNTTPVDVVLNRNLTAGSWNTIVFPFNGDIEGHKLDNTNDYISLYELNMSNTTATSDGMVIEFEQWNGGNIVAGKPYLIKSRETFNLTTAPFENVTLEFEEATNAFKTRPIISEATDAVDFIPVIARTLLTEKSNIVIVGNKLYYPNFDGGGTYIRGLRAYLNIKNGAEQYYSSVRIRIADTGETISLDENTTEIETRKYIENGVLIIERGGVRYDAQGKRIE